MSKLEINPNVEYILAGDISGSMSATDAKCGGNTRYAYMLEKFQSFIKTAEDFDEHGAPTIMLFGENVHVFEHVKLDDIQSKLRNVTFEGFTNLDKLINTAYDLHRQEKTELAADKKVHNGTALIVFTDGEPTNRPAVERALNRIVTTIDREEEFQIHFLTVGQVDASVNKWLDGLHEKMEDKAVNPRDFDIIHVSKLEDTSFFGAISANKHEEKVA